MPFKKVNVIIVLIIMKVGHIILEVRDEMLEVGFLL